MAGVEGSEAEGELIEEVMTEYPIAEGRGREVLMTDEWPIMELIGGGCEREELSAPGESVGGEKQRITFMVW